MSETPAAQLRSPHPDGRRFVARRRIRLADVDPAGEVRLDAIARHMQDVASDDALDAGLPNAMGWVVRRTLIRTETPAVLNEPVELTTFCTGAGRSWAERRTSVTGAAGAAIEAVSLWIQVDVDTGRPTRLGPEFDAIYGPAADGRVVSSKLSLPGPPTGVPSEVWTFRRSDLDPFDHVNNAAQWTALEHALAGRDRRGTAEIEYLAPVGLEPLDLVADGDDRWLVTAGRVATAFRWSPAG